MAKEVVNVTSVTRSNGSGVLMMETNFEVVNIQEYDIRLYLISKVKRLGR
jgi:hypothetical protein